MTIALIHNARLPVSEYGGTERVVWWLARGLSESGHRVILACAPGSECSFAEVRTVDFSKAIEAQLPEAELLHFFNTPPRETSRPYVVTIGGNGRPGEHFLRNTIFVSRNHAERHGAEAFVYNGIDPDEYRFSRTKEDRLLFLAKARWSVKNVRGAIAVARKSRHPLDIAGGGRWFLPRWRGVYWRGMLGGSEKVDLLARARGLLFPVLWNEPFGLAVVEAMVSGTPVIATPFGSLPELVAPGTGFICHSEPEMIERVESLRSLDAEFCRQHVLDRFTYHHMTEGYVAAYRKVQSGQWLNAQEPFTHVDAGAACELKSPEPSVNE